MDPADWIESRFPRLAGGSTYTLTSPIDEDYNCIAFAAGDLTRWWWPNGPFPGGVYWPDGVPQEETLAAFMLAMGTAGFEPCDNGESEDGYEKIAIFAKSGTPTHAARQLVGSGTWTSKLGKGYDIIHESLDGVAGTRYGDVALFMRRTAK